MKCLHLKKMFVSFIISNLIMFATFHQNIVLVDLINPIWFLTKHDKVCDYEDFQSFTFNFTIG